MFSGKGTNSPRDVWSSGIDVKNDSVVSLYNPIVLTKVDMGSGTKTAVVEMF